MTIPPVAMADPLLADPSQMSNCWEESDELMPQSGISTGRFC